MSLHLIKLCVGPQSIEEFAQRIEHNVLAPQRRGEKAEHIHTTRMIPSRKEELLDGGSIYWVIKGQLCVRQKLLDIREFMGEDNIKRCALVFDPTLVRVMPRPSRPFQGWRYLKTEDAPQDLEELHLDASLPLQIALEVRQYGVIS